MVLAKKHHGKGSTVPVQDEKERQSALQKLLEMQRQDFADAWFVGNPGWIFMGLLSAQQNAKMWNVFKFVPRCSTSHQVGRC